MKFLTVNKHTEQLATQELILAFKQCYLTVQKTLLKEIYKAEGEEREQLQQKLKETGQQYEKTLNNLKSWTVLYTT